MHDSQLEDRLRTTLRAEGDGLSMTITTAELERRLAVRQRRERGRMLTAIAAVIAFVAVAAIAALSNGWLRLPAVGATASPTPTETPHVSAGPGATPLAGISAIAATPGRTELFRVDPEAPVSDVSEGTTHFEVGGDVGEVIVTATCIGDGTLTISNDLVSNPERHELACGERTPTRLDGRFHFVDQRADLTWVAHGPVSFAFLVEESPSSEPSPRVAEPVGSAGEAVLVKAIGDDPQRPESFEVTRYDPSTGASVVIATVPGSILPEDGLLDNDFVGPPQVSPTGWLAIPFQRGPNEDELAPALAIVDLQAPTAPPWILDGYKSMSWDPTDKLVVEREDRVSIASPQGRFLQQFAPVGVEARVAANGTAIANGPAVTVEDFTRFLAVRTTDEAWGYLDFDGAFTATTDLPPVYQRSGRERPAGVDAHGLGEACDSGATPASSGCFIVETDAKQKPLATWLDFKKTKAYDFAWAVDGKSVWLLLGDAADDENPVATLAYAPDVDSRADRARIDFATAVRPRILGIADEPTPGSATVVAIGDDQGLVHAFVLDGGDVIEQDGTAWFAGWAVDPAPYDPD